MIQLLQDLRYAFRQLVRNPGFAGVAILTLALGIGANSAIFSTVNGVLIEPLPYSEPDRLMFIHSDLPRLGFERFWVSAPEFYDYQEDSAAFEEIGAYTVGEINVSGEAEPVRVKTVVMTAELWEVLGVEAALGNVFTREQDVPGAELVVVLSDGLWRRAFGGDPSIVGQTVRINEQTVQIAGVMPADFDVADSGAEVFMPMHLDRSRRLPRGSHNLYMIGRLAPGVSEEEARAELDVLIGRWDEKHAGLHRFDPGIHGLDFIPLREYLVGDVRGELRLLLGAVLFVLLIACANVGNLLLVRAEARRKEIAVRTALGAGRRRLLRQFLTEGLVLSTLGAALGLLVAHGGLRLLLSINPESLPRIEGVELDGRVLLFTLGLALLTGIVFGLAPALHLTRASLNEALREGGQRSTSGSVRQRLRLGLMIAEVAIAVVLVIGAGLMVRSLHGLFQVDAGFEPDDILTFAVSPPYVNYPERRDVTAFYERLLERLEALPGVDSAAIANGLPPKRPVDANNTVFEGLPEPPPNEPYNVDFWQFVSPDFFTTLEISLVEGELFDAGDMEGAPPVAIVNQTTVEIFWPDENPIGQRVKSVLPNYPWHRVIGVIKDVKQAGLDAPAGTEIYFSYPQTPSTQHFTPRTMYVILRSELPETSLVAAVRRAVTEIDASLPLAELRTMEEVFGESLARERLLTWLLAIFGVLALVLAAVGTYGVLSFAVAERRREIGIRMALGAEVKQVVKMLLTQGLVIAGIGLAIGVGLALALSRVVQYQFYGIAGTDPSTYVAVVIFIGLVATLACLLPARRAARVDPVEVLREE